MVNVDVDPVFLTSFPTHMDKVTQTIWSNMAIASAGQMLNEGAKCSEAAQRSKMFLEYRNFADLLSKQYPQHFPQAMVADKTLLRKNFNLKGAKKNDPQKQPKLWDGTALLRKFNDVVKREILRDYDPLFFRLWPNGRCPSGKQLEDQVLEFRQEFYKEFRSPKGEGDGAGPDDPEKVAEEVSEGMAEAVTQDVGGEAPVLMPQDYFPPLWLPFVAYGKFSSSPCAIFDGGKNPQAKPLVEMVPSRDQIRALSQAERLAVKEQTDTRSTKRQKVDQLKVSLEMSSTLSGIKQDLADMIATDRMDLAIKRRQYELGELREQIKDAKEDGDHALVAALKAAMAALRAKPLEAEELPRRTPSSTCSTTTLSTEEDAVSALDISFDI